MHWIYQQSTGSLVLHTQSQIIDLVGYAGMGEGLNNPDMQHVKNVGPLPVGRYLINWATKHKKLGEVAMQLIPDPTNKMFNRGDFWMHGDNQHMNQSASNGCIVLSRTSRVVVAASMYRLLEVVR